MALEDAVGNIATNNSSTSVTLTVTGPNSYSQTYSATAATGVAAFNLSSVPLTVSGTYSYLASATSLTSASVSEVVNPAAAAAFSVTGLTNFSAPQMSGAATVTARDAYGNTVTGFTGTVTLSSTDATATFAPASYTYLAGDSGSHTFTVTFNTAGTQTVTATSGTATGSETGIVVSDAIWILNTTDRLVRLTDAGVQTNAVGPTSGSSAFGALAFDNSGNVWATQRDLNTIVKYTAAGASVAVPGVASSGVSSPSSLFVDGIGQVWITNTGSNTVSVLSAAGAAVSPSTGYQPGTLNAPSALVVDSSGSVWITNSGSNTVIRIIGAAAPVVTPTVTGTTNNTLGTRP